jgi:hypothetical protein
MTSGESLMSGNRTVYTCLSDYWQLADYIE